LDDLVPRLRGINPQQFRISVIILVVDVVYEIENAAHVADQYDEYEQAIEDVIEDIEGGADDV
jgi:hypothetical protein